MSYFDRLLATPISFAGAFVGLLACAGFYLLYAGLPRTRRPGLEARMAPYLRDAPRPSRLLARQSGLPTRLPLLTILAPLVTDAANVVERVLGGSASVRKRLQRAGKAPEVDRFRVEQVLWGAIAGGVALVLATLAVVRRGAPIGPLVITVLLAVAGGVLARDYWLTHEAEEREARMLAEFPTIAEMLALAVSAGEGAIGALERVTRMSRGELSGELSACLADARAGANLPTALQGLADRTGLVSLARFVDGIVVAVERGTPLADVLRAQAQDVRELGRRAILEEGGRKEIAMMVPVVFLVLPITILFALYPGFVALKFTL